MKPRLDPCDYTMADVDAWSLRYRLARDLRFSLTTETVGRAGDRVDADLMLALAYTVKYPGTAGPTARVLVYFSTDTVRDQAGEMFLSWAPGRFDRTYLA